MTEDEQEREEVRERTERNRKAVPDALLVALAAMSLSLDDVLKMTRQEFDDLNRRLFENNISDDDRTALIVLKHDSMTHDENLIYFEPTDEEWDEMERDEL